MISLNAWLQQKKGNFETGPVSTFQSQAAFTSLVCLVGCPSETTRQTQVQNPGFWSRKPL